MGIKTCPRVPGPGSLTSRLSSCRVAGPVLVAWEHINIQYLTADLGVAKKSIPNWVTAHYSFVKLEGKEGIPL